MSLTKNHLREHYQQNILKKKYVVKQKKTPYDATVPDVHFGIGLHRAATKHRTSDVGDVTPDATSRRPEPPGQHRDSHGKTTTDGVRPKRDRHGGSCGP